jgi:hypothetical protein
MTPILLATILVLRSGERIAADRIVERTPQRVVFAVGQALYSLPASEIDKVADDTPATTKDDGAKKLKVSAEERERLLRELEQNHNGTPMPLTPTLQKAPPPEPDRTDDEWRWRAEARAHEESVLRAKENLELLLQRAERLKGEITGLLGLGFKPNQFTFQTTQLQSVLEQIPYAQLDLERARRANEQFREDARKQGVMPGWLR